MDIDLSLPALLPPLTHTRLVRLFLSHVGTIHFAADYKNEAEVGEALQEAFQTGLVKREELFITTKVGVVKLANYMLFGNMRSSNYPIFFCI